MPRTIDDRAKTCHSCFFWQPDEEQTGYGECRANPPSGNDWAGVANFPRTCHEDWCGGFRRGVAETRRSNDAA
jgi:hypothetical protein